RHASTTQSAFLGKAAWECGLELDAGAGWDMRRALLAARAPLRDLIMHGRQDDGRPYYISVSGEPIFDHDGCFAGYRGVTRDITDQELAEERIQHLATHDGLTGLPNRVMFSHLLSTAIPAAYRDQRSFAVLFIDLDRFKFINDTLGHEAGDMLLKEVASRFKAVLRGSDVVARLGGDEFVVLLPELNQPALGQCRTGLGAAGAVHPGR
ncbi:MAG: diguanylate cyclase domain-containing protein, partial [Noviherbaspirillum sp.]